MRRNHDTQSIASTDEQHTATDTSRSRRGFLKQTAVAGLLGMTGLTVVTESASATKTTEALSEAPEPVRTIEVTDTAHITDTAEPIRLKIRESSDTTDQNNAIGTMDYRGFDKKVYIYGNSWGTTNYTIYSNGDIIKAPESEPSDNDNFNDKAKGEVVNFGYDAYYVEYGVDLILNSSGDVNYDIDDI